MITEKEFFEELGRVPALPAETFDTIRGTIARRRNVARALYSLAATLVIALGMTFAFLARSDTAVAGAPAAEAASELQTVHDYLNGNDLDQELQVYAVYYEE